MEPSRGASTCAFGSHRWKINIGIFTKKAIIIKIEKLILKQVIEENSIFELYFISITPINKGSEAVMVYNTIYIPACKRSG